MPLEDAPPDAGSVRATLLYGCASRYSACSAKMKLTWLGSSSVIPTSVRGTRKASETKGGSIKPTTLTQRPTQSPTGADGGPAASDQIVRRTTFRQCRLKLTCR